MIGIDHFGHLCFMLPSWSGTHRSSRTGTSTGISSSYLYGSRLGVEEVAVCRRLCGQGVSIIASSIIGASEA